MDQAALQTLILAWCCATAGSVIRHQQGFLLRAFTFSLFVSFGGALCKESKFHSDRSLKIQQRFFHGFQNFIIDRQNLVNQVPRTVQSFLSLKVCVHKDERLVYMLVIETARLILQCMLCKAVTKLITASECSHQDKGDV